MSSNRATQADSTLSEFSSALLCVDTEGLDADETIVDISSSGYESLDNNHLSSVLSQIQDEGPAYDELKTSDNVTSHVTPTIDNSIATDFRQDNKSMKNDEVSSDKVNLASVKTIFLKKLANHTKLLQVLLILFIAAVTFVILSNFDTRASNLELAMIGYEEELQESISTQNETLEPKVFKINKALSSVMKRLQIVEAKFLALDKKYEVITKENVASNDSERLAIKDNVKVLEDEILALKTNVKTIKNNFKTIADNTVVSENKRVSNGLIVSLASLTNMDKVNDLVKKLYASGLWPSVEKAMVNGKRVYRISVRGFEDLAAAELFINSAGKQYGTAGGRIRKS